MIRITNIKLPLDHNEDLLLTTVCKKIGIRKKELVDWQVAKRSTDARNRSAIKLIYSLDITLNNEQEILAQFSKNSDIGPQPDTNYHYVVKAPSAIVDRPIVIGTGPCGLFAGLILAQMGFRPIILERGKKVRERTVDTFNFWRQGQLNPESNVQFGEGGAGTFSDGKLYTGTKDKNNRNRKVLTELVESGANEEILYINKPHIGTFKLVKIVENMRQRITEMGGEIHFNSRVEDLMLENEKIAGVILASGKRIQAKQVVLAVGHSARDTFSMLHKRGVRMTAKPFSIGFRIEHPQSLIDQCRYGKFAGHPLLGAADYKLVHHCSNGRSVYSFCMCPGGTVVAAASEVGGVVTNGMSQYSRAENNANSGIVVGITPDDYPGGPLAGIEFQRHWEKQAYIAGGKNYDAPAQLVGDFLRNRKTQQLSTVEPSYRPGVSPADLSTCLPDYAVAAIREALPAFDKQINGFAMNDALLVAVETRTSSPVSIPRDDTLQSVSTTGLFPAGEGAGYAGGILSAAVDGIKIAEAVASNILSSQ